MIGAVLTFVATRRPRVGSTPNPSPSIPDPAAAANQKRSAISDRALAVTGLMIGAFAAIAAIVAIVPIFADWAGGEFARESDLRTELADPWDDFIDVTYVLPPGADLPAVVTYCDETSVKQLRTVSQIADPVISVAMSNSHTTGDAGSLYVSQIRFVARKTPNIPQSSTFWCPTGGASEELLLAADLDESDLVGVADPFSGKIDPSVGQPAFTLAPGENVRFRIALEATDYTYQGVFQAEVRNGNGDSWTVTFGDGQPITVPGTGAAIAHIAPSDAVGTFLCETADIASFSCTLESAPSAAELEGLRSREPVTETNPVRAQGAAVPDWVNCGPTSRDPSFAVKDVRRKPYHLCRTGVERLSH